MTTTQTAPSPPPPAPPVAPDQPLAFRRLVVFESLREAVGCTAGA